MSMDPHHVHNFWGVSPALDVRQVVRQCRLQGGGVRAVSCASHDPSEPSPNFSTLLVGTNDPRHIFTTTARSRRHGSSADAAPPTTSFFVHESSTVELARHVLLLCVLMTDDVPPADRVERFLEIFGNFTLRESTSQLVQRLAARLERVVGAIFAGETTDAPNNTPDRIATVFDFSLLKFKEKDALMDVFRSWGGDDVNSKHFDPDKKRDLRLRKLYGDRFDHRRNIIDWDYHMRLDAAGAGVVHMKHFASFRCSGIAFPVREATFPCANKTLLGFAEGTTKEWKNRDARDVGRVVDTFGFWGDITNGPYIGFGTDAENPGQAFAMKNRQHRHNAVEISEMNVASRLFETRAGVPWGEFSKNNGTKDGSSLEVDEAELETDLMNAACVAEEVGGDASDTSNAGDASTAISPDGKKEWRGGDGAVFHETWASLRVTLVGPGNFDTGFLGKPKRAEAFHAVVVGAWAVQRVTPTLAKVVKPGGVLITEGSKYLLAADGNATAAFAEKTLALANLAGFQAVPFDDTEPVDDEPVTESGMRHDGSRRPKRLRFPGVVKGVDDVHRFYVKQGE